ncbi:MAG: PIN domain-containing protein [Rhizobiaceae bacterium]
MKRFGLDANVILRALLNDHPRQSVLARNLLAGLGETRRAYLGVPALLEIFWVLRSRYKVPQSELCETMRELLMIRYLDVESSDAVAQALSIYEKGRGEFEDALLAARNAEVGLDFTYTFDKDAAKAILTMELLA